MRERNDYDNWIVVGFLELAASRWTVERERCVAGRRCGIIFGVYGRRVTRKVPLNLERDNQVLYAYRMMKLFYALLNGIMFSTAILVYGAICTANSVTTNAFCFSADQNVFFGRPAEGARKGRDCAIN